MEKPPTFVVNVKRGLVGQLRAHGLTAADLARTMRCSRTTADRILDENHNSTLDQLDIAAAALGLSIELSVTPAGAKQEEGS